MATITMDPVAKTVTAQLSDVEYQVVAWVVAQQGGSSAGLVSVVQSYVEQKHREYVDGQVQKIQSSAPALTDAQRTSILTIIGP